MKKILLTALLLLSFGLISSNSIEVSAGRPEMECTYEYQESYFDLWAGQHILAGNVVISNDETNIYIDIYADNGAIMQEAHVYIYYNEVDIPNSRPAPGQADFVLENQFSDHIQFVIPETFIEGDTFYFVIHVAFSSGTNSDDIELGGETAYAGDVDTPINLAEHGWFYGTFHTVLIVEDCHPVGRTQSETAWVYYGLDSYEISPDDRWGWYSVFEPGSYAIYAAAGRNDLNKGLYVGQAIIDMQGNVTFDMNDGVVIEEYHVYIGLDIPTKQAIGKYSIGDLYDPNTLLPGYIAIHLDVTFPEPETTQ